MGKEASAAPSLSWPEIISLLSDLVVFNQYDFQEFLQRLIKIAVKIVPVDSSLIYFFDSEKKQLTLVGSQKSHDNVIENIRIREGEGITGWVAEHKQTVAITEKAYLDPRFKFFKELPEDKYESFLSVPIMNDEGIVGVINFQNRKAYTFSQEQIQTLEAIVKIISSGFVKVALERKVDTLSNKLEERKVIEKAKGVLMKLRNLSEEEAFRLIRQESMNKRKSMKEIAEAILLVWQ